MTPDPALLERLARHGQERLLQWWPELVDTERAARSANSPRSTSTASTPSSRGWSTGTSPAAPPPELVRPIDVIRLPRTDAERIAQRLVAEEGAAALAAGEVAVVIVAGGLGTRLGFEGPKGTYPIGPVSAVQPVPDPRREDRARAVASAGRSRST